MITNIHGNTLLCFGGYMFSKHVENKGKIRWRCRKPKCSAAVYTYQSDVISFKDSHNH